MAWTPKNTVVVPVDLSEECLAAINTALDLVAEPSGLHVVHVLPELSPIEPTVAWEAMQSSLRHRHADEEIRKWLSDPKYRDLSINIFVGEPAHEITLFAERVKAELIVMPSHGRTGIKRFLIGSIAERTVRLAHCPVLVLRR